MLLTDFKKSHHKKFTVNSETKCWEWIGSKSKRGYGVLRKNDRLVFAYKVSYESNNGKVPSGLVLDHLCSNKSCVNPDHLEAVTQNENVRRYFSSKGKAKICKMGHDLCDSNTYKTAFKGKLLRKCKTCALRYSKDRYAKTRKVVD